MPSVVGITTVSIEQENLWGSIERNEGIGTGVIVHEDGYILTNSHVIENGNVEEVRVILNSGENIVLKCFGLTKL